MNMICVDCAHAVVRGEHSGTPRDAVALYDGDSLCRRHLNERLGAEDAEREAAATRNAEAAADPGPSFEEWIATAVADELERRKQTTEPGLDTR